MQRAFAVEPDGELSRATNLLAKRPPRRIRRRRQRAEPQASTPQRERNETKRQQQRRSAIAPHQREDRRALVGQEQDIVAAVKLGGRNEQQAVLPLQQLAIAEWTRIDHRRAALPDVDADGLKAARVA